MVVHRALLLFCLLLIFGAWPATRIGAASSPPDWLSPRPIDSCLKANDEPDSCFNGDIRGIDASVDGQVVIFESDGNRFVPNDSNRLADIFVWQAGNIQRASEGANGEQADHASDRAALAGNGRYLYFRSQAGNLVAETMRGRLNLYLKELATGRLTVVSRNADGTPINVENLTDHFMQIDADYSGRYVVFSSIHANFVEGVIDTNQAQDVFLADVDPDGNGDYFDSTPQLYLLSALADGITAGNGASFEPTITQDGSAVAWLTRATDLAPGLASNGNVIDVLLAHLERLPDGSINPGTRTLLAINRMGDDSAALTPQGARLARIDPWRDQVAFVTADDIPGSGDDHAGQDVYLSVGNGDDANQRHIVWVSHAYSSTEPSALSIAWDPLLPPATLAQVAWIAQNSPRVIDDLLIQRAAPFYPAGWSIANWVAATTPSSAAVTNGTLSADGRFALWTTDESYGLDVPPGSANLFRREIAPPQSVALTVNASGGGASYAPVGVLLNHTMHYSSTTLVTLTAQADVGHRFRDWEGVDARDGVTATVLVYTTRVVTAIFDTMTPPIAHDVTLTITEDAPRQIIPLTISDPDPDESHMITLAEPPSHGEAAVTANVIYYQPAPDFNGQDSFTLQVTDAYGLQLAQAAAVTVHVTPVNDAPVAASAQGSGTNNGTAIPMLVEVQDPDVDDSYTLAVESAPTAGNVQIGTQLHTQNYFEYTPQAEFVGVDSFTFRVTDSGDASIVGTATVTVTLGDLTASYLLLPTLRRSSE